MEVILTKSQLLVCGNVGDMRHINALLAKSRNGYGLSEEDDGWGKHVEGACGECAAAMATGRFWPCSVDTFHTECDIAGADVRTRSRPCWDLIVRPKDKDDRPMILVTGRAPKFKVHGWAYAGEAKQDRYWQAYGGRDAAWFFPQAGLRPLETLPPLLVPKILVESVS